MTAGYAEGLETVISAISAVSGHIIGIHQIKLPIFSARDQKPSIRNQGNAAAAEVLISRVQGPVEAGLEPAINGQIVVQSNKTLAVIVSAAGPDIRISIARGEEK